MPLDGDLINSAIAVLSDAFSSFAAAGVERVDCDFTSIAASKQTVQDIFCALQQFAFCEARTVGLQEADAHDCAMDLVLRVLQQSPVAQASASVAVTRLILRHDLPPEQGIAWLRRCSRNHAADYRRRLAVRSRKEADCGKEHTHDHLRTTASSAENAMFRRLFRHDVYAAAQELPPEARAAFDRFHLHEDGIVEIALSSGNSTEAVKKTVQRARQRVKTRLAERGHAPEGKTAAERSGKDSFRQHAKK